MTRYYIEAIVDNVEYSEVVEAESEAQANSDFINSFPYDSVFRRVEISLAGDCA